MCVFSDVEEEGEGLTVNSELVLRQKRAMWYELLDSKAAVISTVFNLNVIVKINI